MPMHLSNEAPERIKVVCRVRPFLKQETVDQSLIVKGNTVELENQRNPCNPHRYKFASCYDDQSTQSQIFEKDVRPLADRVFQGFDSTIFAYGVTGSGKTYTMEGTGVEPGIIPRVAEFLFETKEASLISSIRITMSYVEIFKESVYDLLLPKQRNTSGLEIREGTNRDIFIANLKEVHLETLEDFQNCFAYASQNRSTASTKLNIQSSRSHAILTLTVSTSTPVDIDDPNSPLHTVSGKINLIDLAGSEDNRKTGNGKDRMSESAAINKSLFVLGQVVEALNTGSERIPFRDSKMTRILQPTLCGNALGMMIINVAPGKAHFSDSCSTLNFANKSKEIRYKPKPPPRPTKSHAMNSKENVYPSPPAASAKRRKPELYNGEHAMETRSKKRRAKAIQFQDTPDIHRYSPDQAFTGSPNEVLVMTRAEFDRRCEVIVNRRVEAILKERLGKSGHQQLDRRVTKLEQQMCKYSS
ncbi:P-loop containing nucleoside triphosphate hydrolase protein [Syncephalastrum racemosum]|uniref:Kinesin-like protein n=1 Tax=Syncephalastrum racemosum TaxID=13706 RepID=A0A1X2HG06_SYNRA|nr:P-loop containing nucleoside triphosphate hydrolase protein [Syncephalastrum racemosum]